MRKIHNLSKKKEFRKKLRNNATPQEKILWLKLKNGQLGVKFRRQHSIGPYIIDFYCSEKKLIIELDGGQHIEKQKKHDDKRSDYLKKLNFTILRFWDNEVNNNLNGVLYKISEFIN